MTLKRFLLTLVALAAATLLQAQVRIDNYPLPQHPDTLRILAVGNSFSDDGTEYLPGLLEAAGIRNVIVARLYIGGCTLERHCKEYAEGTANYIYYKSTKNAWVTVSRNATLLDGLKDEPWDIITIQQASDDSGIYNTYEQGIPKLVSIIRKEAPNPHAAIVWHMGVFGLDERQMAEYKAAIKQWPVEIIMTHAADHLASVLEENDV